MWSPLLELAGIATIPPWPCICPLKTIKVAQFTAYTLYSDGGSKNYGYTHETTVSSTGSTGTASNRRYSLTP